MMLPREQIIEEFYSGFADGNSVTMCSCYHQEIVFQDPIFGILVGNDAKDMWEMLIKKSKGNLEINFTEVFSDGKRGSANWTAKYIFSSTNNFVFNKIHAEFEFFDGLIYRHADTFNFYSWAKQAFGIKGFLLGWTPFFKKKVQHEALQSLRKYQLQKQKNL